MNAIIALCHFCELDGPNILFCTQSYHSSTLEHSARKTGVHSSDGQPMYFDGSRHNAAASAAAGPSSPSACSDSGSTISFNFTVAADGRLQGRGLGAGGGDEQRRCLTCRVLGTELPGFVTNDHNAHVSYVSTTFPVHPTLFTVVRKACVRSLSCEVLPGREGAAMYGDSKNGYVLSYTFIIKDCNARGFQRSYSLLFLMTDKNHLLNSFPFIVNQFRQVVENLKNACQRTYDMDVKARRPGPAAPQTGGMGVADSFRRRRSTVQLRSLMDLTQNKQLAVMLHRTFSWTLMTASTRVYEKQLEGPPTISGPSVMGEGDDVTNELHFELAATILSLPPTFRTLLQRLGISGGAVSSHPNPGATRTRSLSYARAGSNARTSASSGGDVVGPGIRGISLDAMADSGLLLGGPVLYTLPQLVQILGRETFRVVCYHAIVGNQVIVRGACADTVISILAALAHLLPKACAVMVPYSDDYRDRWQCNLLGLRDSVAIPPHIDISSYAVLDVKDTALAQPFPQGGIAAGGGGPGVGATARTPESEGTSASPSQWHHHNATKMPGVKATYDVRAAGATCSFVRRSTLVSSSSRDVQVVLSRSASKAHNEFSPHKAMMGRGRAQAEGPADTDSYGHFDDFVMVDDQGDRGAPTFKFNTMSAATSGNGGVSTTIKSARSMASTPTPSKENLESRRPPMQYKLPRSARSMKLLERIVGVMTSAECSDSVKMQQLTALKEDWFNNAKVFFQFARLHANASDPSAISRLVHSLGLSPSDLPVLRFWASGLTREDRARLLSTHVLLQPRVHSVKTDPKTMGRYFL